LISHILYSPLRVGAKSLSAGFRRSELFKTEGLGERSEKTYRTHIAEFGSEQKITQFKRDIRLTLLEAATPVGCLLLISLSEELNLKFEGITYSKFIDEKTLLIDELKLIKEVKNKSQAFSLKDEELQQQILSHKSKNYDPWQVCCGHHLVEILSVGLCKALGTNNTSDVETNSLERSLRLAYEEVYFRTTQIYSEIRVWESKNQPFRVLRNDM